MEAQPERMIVEVGHQKSSPIMSDHKSMPIAGRWLYPLAWIDPLLNHPACACQTLSPEGVPPILLCELCAHRDPTRPQSGDRREETDRAHVMDTQRYSGTPASRQGVPQTPAAAVDPGGQRTPPNPKRDDWTETSTDGGSADPRCRVLIVTLHFPSDSPSPG